MKAKQKENTIVKHSRKKKQNFNEKNKQQK